MSPIWSIKVVAVLAGLHSGTAMRFSIALLLAFPLLAGPVLAQLGIVRGTEGTRPFQPGNSCTSVVVEGPEAQRALLIRNAELVGRAPDPARMNAIGSMVRILVATSPAEAGIRCIERKMARIAFVDLESGAHALDLALEPYGLELADGAGGMRSWPAGRVNVELAQFKTSLVGNRYSVEVHHEGGHTQRLEQGGLDRAAVWTAALTSRVQ